MEIFKYLGEYGLHPWMIFIVLLLLGTIFILRDGLIAKLKSFKWRKKEKEHKIGDLINHDIFHTFKRVKKEVAVMKFFTDGKYDLVKTRMCQDFTNFKCDVCSEGFGKFLETDIDKLSTDALKSLILDMMWGVHDEYIDKIRHHWLDKGIPSDDVQYVIECFDRFRFEVVQAFQFRVDAIFASSFYNNNFERVLASYDMFAMGVDLLPRDLQTTFETLNGKFKNIKY